MQQAAPECTPLWGRCLPSAPTKTHRKEAHPANRYVVNQRGDAANTFTADSPPISGGAAAGFSSKSRQGITRAHLRPRIDTVRNLLLPDKPLSEREFFETWLTNDRTILCAKGENRRAIPKYIPIENEDGTLFSCHGKLAGWHHRKREREFLKELFHGRPRHSLVAPPV